MSATIKNKLTDLAIDPPKGSWDKIATELDDSASGMQFPSRLHELTVTPPLTAWSFITASLDQEIPSNTIAAKLATAEVAPPVMAWEKIKSALASDVRTEAPVKRLPPFLRYAAAAVLIGVIAFASIRLINNSSKDNSTAAVASDKKTQITAPVLPTVEPVGPEVTVTLTDAGKKEDDARNDAALEASKKTYAKLDVTPRKKVDAVAGFNFASMLGDDVEEPESLGIEDEMLQNDAADNNKRYIVLMTPDGHFIRMSKKLSDLLCCVSGEEEDIKCRTQVDKWRKQIACSPTPHPGNFMDILSLLGSLQEN